MRHVIVVSILIALIGGGVLFFSRRGDREGEGTKQESLNFNKAPEFTLSDYEGNTVRLSDFAGKVRVVNSWAVWCPFCKDELPDFASLQEEYKDKAVVIAIDRQEPLEKAKGFTDSLDITDKMVFLLDPNDSFYQSIGGFSMPETIFVDGEGNIRFHKRGPMPLEEMREKVEEILQSNA